MAKDKILTYRDYQDEPFPRLNNSHQDYDSWLRGMYELFQGEAAPDTPSERETSVKAYVNAGRWLWRCQGCNASIPADDKPSESGLPAHYGHPSICPECATDGWVDVLFPRTRRSIEAELLKQPGRRSNAPVRHWKLGWKIQELKDRTTKAKALLAAGHSTVRALSIGATRDWMVAEVLTAANMDTYVSDLIEDLAGRNGPVEFEDAIVIDSLTTTERNALTVANGMLIYNMTKSLFERYENGAWREFTDLASLTISGAAQGDVFIRGATGIQRLGAGTARQIFRTGGTGANPAWQDLVGTKIDATTTRGSLLVEDSNGRVARLAPSAIVGDSLMSNGTNADLTYGPVAITGSNLALILALS